jgi:hypothetical protein
MDKQERNKIRTDHSLDWCNSSTGVPTAKIREIIDLAKQYQSDPIPRVDSTMFDTDYVQFPQPVNTRSDSPARHWLAIPIDEHLLHRSKFHPPVIWACIRAWWAWPTQRKERGE